MVASTARAVQPPDLPIGMLLRQCVKHGEDRRRADAGADQQHGRMRPVEDERATGCCDVELVADGEPGVEIAAGGAVVFPLDGDAVVAGAGRSRQRVVAEHRSLTVPGLDSQREVLAGACRGERCAAGVLEADRDHRVALALDRGDGQPAESGPGRRRARDGQAGVAGTRLSVEQGAERSLPAGAERGDPERSEQLLSRVPGEVEKRVDFGDRHLLLPGGDLEDLVTRLDLALFEHAEVEAGAAVGDQQRRNPRIVHADPDAVTGDAGLGDLEEGGADPVAVADADLVVAQPFHREVLAELPVDEVASSELVLPVAIGLDLVDEDGAVLAAVPGEIALAVAVHVERAYAARRR